MCTELAKVLAEAAHCTAKYRQDGRSAAKKKISVPQTIHMRLCNSQIDLSQAWLVLVQYKRKHRRDNRAMFPKEAVYSVPSGEAGYGKYGDKGGAGDAGGGIGSGAAGQAWAPATAEQAWPPAAGEQTWASAAGATQRCISCFGGT